MTFRSIVKRHTAEDIAWSNAVHVVFELKELQRDLEENPRDEEWRLLQVGKVRIAFLLEALDLWLEKRGGMRSIEAKGPLAVETVLGAGQAADEEGEGQGS